MPKKGKQKGAILEKHTDWDQTPLIQHYLSIGACKKPLEVISKFADHKQLSECAAVRIYEKCMRAIDIQELIDRYKPEHADILTPKKSLYPIYGAIYSDCAGAPYECRGIPKEKRKLFIPSVYDYTDDSVLTVATEDALSKIRKIKYKNKISEKTIDNFETITGETKEIFAESYYAFGNRHLDAGFGPAFVEWLNSTGKKPYGSNGNGSAMRVSPVGAAGLSYEDTAILAILSACCTHDHIEGIRGAVTEAISVWMACCGCSVEDIFSYMKHIYTMPGENLFHEFTFEEAAAMKYYQIQCQFSVPASIICVYEILKNGGGFDDVMEKTFAVGIDTDTNACIAGAIAAELCKEEKVLDSGEKVKEEIGK